MRFELPDAPKRIEVYDNSHIMGTAATGAMIVAGPTGFAKNSYRKFNIKKAATDDDFAMMKEVLERRFQRLEKDDPDRSSGEWPDLILIDGGRGQIERRAGNHGRCWGARHSGGRRRQGSASRPRGAGGVSPAERA
jgi:excinuclease UvrABC nuclease subunit